MKNEKVKKTLAAVLAGAMCFGLVGVRQNVTAKQNIRSNENNIKNSSDRITASSETENGSEGKLTVAGDAVEEYSSLYKLGFDEKTGRLEYVYFGSYPQREITGDELTEDIVNAQYVSGVAVVAGEKYCRVAKEDADYTVYEYADNLLQDNDGLKYAGEEEREKYWQQQVNRMQMYMYNWGTENYHYFKYEPIKWRVSSRDGDKLELCAMSALDTRRYWYSRTPYSGMLRNCGWGSSTVRQWLNSEQDGFFNRAFDVKEQAVIQTLEEEFLGEMYDGKEWKNYVKIHLKDKVTLGVGACADSKYEVMTVSDYAFAMGIRSYDADNRKSRIWAGASLYGEGFANYIDEYGYFHRDSLAMPSNKEKYYYVEYSNKKGLGIVPSIVIQADKSDLPPQESEEVTKEPKKSNVPMTAPPIKTSELLQSPISSEDSYNSHEPVDSEPVVSMQPGIPGDVNGDFTVDLKDAQLALKAALNLVQLNGEQVKRAAVTERNEHIITLKDAQIILRWALNLR